MLVSFIRAIFLYLVLIGCIRLMGKRQIGEMEPAEFVVTMLIANLAAIPMQESGLPLFSGLVPILTVLAMQLVLAFLSMRFLPVRRLLCGKPVILIHEGQVRQSALRACRITIDELQEHLRENGVLNLNQVQYAILETNGQVSVFPYARFQPAPAGDGARDQSLPVTLVSDGKLLTENLKAAGRDRAWVGRTLREKGAGIAATFLLTVDGQGEVCHIRKEGRP